MPITLIQNNLRQYLDILPQSIKFKYDKGNVWIDDEWLDPFMSQKIRNHSLTGFNIGYQGSGPAQLALAILLCYWPIDLALLFYQEFKREYIASLHGEYIDTYVHLRAIMTSIAVNQNQSI